MYRVFCLGHDGHIAGPATLIDSLDDGVVIEEAKQFLDGRVLGIWEFARLVARLDPSQKNE